MLMDIPIETATSLRAKADEDKFTHEVQNKVSINIDYNMGLGKLQIKLLVENLELILACPELLKQEKDRIKLKLGDNTGAIFGFLDAQSVTFELDKQAILSRVAIIKIICANLLPSINPSNQSTLEEALISEIIRVQGPALDMLGHIMAFPSAPGAAPGAAQVTIANLTATLAGIQTANPIIPGLAVPPVVAGPGPAVPGQGLLVIAIVEKFSQLVSLDVFNLIKNAFLTAYNTAYPGTTQPQADAFNIEYAKYKILPRGLNLPVPVAPVAQAQRTPVQEAIKSFNPYIVDIPNFGKGCTSSSMSIFISAHGDDLTTEKTSMVDTILGLEFEFGDDKSNPYKTSYYQILEPAYPDEDLFRAAFGKYLTNNIYANVSMGEPGPSAPMDDGDVMNDKTKWKFLSSSEMELIIVGRFYKYLYKFGKSYTAGVPPPPLQELIDAADAAADADDAAAAAMKEEEEYEDEVKIITTTFLKSAASKEQDSPISYPKNLDGIDIDRSAQGTPNNAQITNCELYKLNTIIRHQLRSNFLRIWDRLKFLYRRDALEGKSNKRARVIFEGNDEWQRHWQYLVVQHKIWLLKRLNEFSFDRYFQLEPNPDDNPKFRPHEGLHIDDMRDDMGKEILYSPPAAQPAAAAAPRTGIDGTLIKFDELKIYDMAKRSGLRESTIVKTNPANEFLDVNNLSPSLLIDDNRFKERFLEYIKTRIFVIHKSVAPVAPVAPKKKKRGKTIKKNTNDPNPSADPNIAIQTAIKGILNSANQKQIYLSEICLLGFLLNIKMFTIWDPACRPYLDEGRQASTRSNKIYKSSELFRIDDPVYINTDESLIIQPSSKLNKWLKIIASAEIEKQKREAFLLSVASRAKHLLSGKKQAIRMEEGGGNNINKKNKTYKKHKSTIKTRKNKK
jgi:hypothetical protein